MNQEKTIDTPTNITVKELAEHLEVPATDVIEALMENGVMATINDNLDFETAAIVAEDFGVALEKQAQDNSEENQPSGSDDLRQKTVLAENEGELRPPVVVVMGHVDHGKTTLLDTIRSSNIASGESGGITQHIGAYQIEHDQRLLTFLDTPGHEAFSVMRRHGAYLTDVAVVVVAADDGVQPQTEEVINFAKRAGVQMVVAINKIDKPEADPQRVKQQLSEYDLVPEDWGGDTVMVEVSAKQGDNLDQLLDMILLVADLNELRARPDGPAEGVIVEAHKERGMGVVTTVLIEHGQLSVGDYCTGGAVYCKVRSMRNHQGERIEQAGSSTPVLISGWKGTPQFGDDLFVVEDEQTAKDEVAEYQKAHREESESQTSKEAVFSAIAASKTNTFNLVVKADVKGSLRAVMDSLDSLGNEEVQANVVASGIGNISESDVATAASAEAGVVGFNVDVASRIQRLAARENVPVQVYTVIYNLLDDVREAMNQQLEPEIVEEQKATLELRGIFKQTKTNLVCGGLVKSGAVEPGLLVRTMEDDPREVGSIKNVQQDKQNVDSVEQGRMCGLRLDTKEKIDLKEGELLEFYTKQEKQRKI